MRTAVFSILSPNYRHYARVLMHSVRQHHPEWDRFVLLVDEQAIADRDEPYETVPLPALPLPHKQQFCFRYTILELNTAVKPWMFEHLFARGYDRVIYLDPDTRLFSRLEELDAPDVFLTLTPHLTGSIPGDEHPSERTILQAGAYNLGFLAVNRHPELPRFLAWWQSKLEYQCLFDTARGLFVDQKWMDLVPGLFAGVRILRHDGYNVGYWNLRQRTVTGVSVNDVPLRFFHFSGFDPATPGTVSKHDHRLQMADVHDARALFASYATDVRNAGSESFRNARYAYGTFHDGTRIPDAARAAWRNSPSLQRACGDDPFAHPELFRGIGDPLVTRMSARTYRFLSRAHPLVRLLPRSLRSRLRDIVLGRSKTQEKR